jgi:Response regulators consisting of a CheY-like receiver domain and a winged-helix DNA-binding domain
MTTRILVVEDDTMTRMSMVAILEAAGYHVTAAADGESAIVLLQQAVAEEWMYTVVITDIWMEMIDGIEVLYAARRNTRPPEVIILTGYGTMDTSIAALRAGAYDYLIKPCNPDELLAYVAGAVERHTSENLRDDAMRVINQAVEQLQHGQQTPDSATEEALGDRNLPERYVRIGDLEIDMFRRTVMRHNQLLHLTPTEYNLLSCLAHVPGCVVEYADIAYHTHKYRADKPEAHSLLKTHIQNLRRKVGAGYIVSVRGIGYMLVDPTAEGMHAEKQQGMCVVEPDRHDQMQKSDIYQQC